MEREIAFKDFEEAVLKRHADPVSLETLSDVSREVTKKLISAHVVDYGRAVILRIIPTTSVPVVNKYGVTDNCYVDQNGVCLTVRKETVDELYNQLKVILGK